MLNLAEHETLNAHKYIMEFSFFSGSDDHTMFFPVYNWVEHEFFNLGTWLFKINHVVS